MRCIPTWPLDFVSWGFLAGCKQRGMAYIIDHILSMAVNGESAIHQGVVMGLPAGSHVFLLTGHRTSASIYNIIDYGFMLWVVSGAPLFLKWFSDSDELPATDPHNHHARVFGKRPLSSSTSEQGALPRDSPLAKVLSSS